MTGTLPKACLWSAIFLMVAVQAAAAEHTKDSLKDVRSNIEKEKAVLVDVREPKEWKAGHVQDAVLLSLSELSRGIDREKLAERLPKDTILYTHCAVGKRSLVAAEILTKHGYEVRPLKAGYKDLLQAGFKRAEEKSPLQQE